MQEAGAEAAVAGGETTLAEVIARWGEDYKIGGCPQEGYGALRRDGTAGHVFADTPGELWDALALDSLGTAPGARG